MITCTTIDEYYAALRVALPGEPIYATPEVIAAYNHRQHDPRLQHCRQCTAKKSQKENCYMNEENGERGK